MANLTTVNEPTYRLDLTADELTVVRAVIGDTSGTSLEGALGRKYTQAELLAIGTVWDALDPQGGN